MTREQRAELRRKRRRDRMLHQRAMARREAYQNDPARLTEPLNRRTLDRESGAAERLRFGEKDRQLRGEYGASQEHARRGAGWFQDYLNQIRQSEERTRAAYAAQQAAQQQTAEAAYAQDQARSQQLSAQEAAAAVQRGASVDPGLARTAEQAAASRRTGSQQQAGLTGTLGANAGAYLAARGNVAAGQGVQFQQDEARRGRGVQQRQAALADKKGDFRVAYRADAREKERRYGLELSVFGQREQSEAQDAADDAADNTRQGRADRSRARDRDARRRQARDRENLSRAQFIAKYGITPEQAAQGVEPARGTGRGGGGRGRRKGGVPGVGGGGSFGGGGGERGSSVTPTQRREAKRTFRSAVARARQQNPEPTEGRALIDELIAQGVVSDPLMARAVAMTAIYGGVDENTRRRVYREYGIYLRVSPRSPRRGVR